MVRLYCFLRLNLKTRILSPRPWAAILARTRAVLRASPRTISLDSFEIARMRSNSTAAPISPAIVSTSIVCPGVTRYCLPPVSMTAYMIQPFFVGFRAAGERQPKAIDRPRALQHFLGATQAFLIIAEPLGSASFNLDKSENDIALARISLAGYSSA